MENSLVKFQQLTASQVFEEGQLLDMVSEVETEVRSVIIDASTPKGRDEVKSLAYKIAQTKTFVDKTRKAYIDDKQEFIKKVNAISKTAVERLQALQDEVRKPVTEFEEREKKRVQGIKDSIDSIIKLRDINGLCTIEVIKETIKKAEDFDAVKGMDEFTHHAIKAKEETLNYLSGVLIAREEYEENEKQRLELLKREEERKQKEREEALVAKAKADAELEANRKIEEEKARIQKEADEKVRLAKEESDRIAKEVQDKIDQEKREQEEIKAKEKAEEDRKNAEADRIKKEEEARARNIEHQKKINNETKDFFISQGCSEDQAITIVKLIATGKAPNLTLRY